MKNIAQYFNNKTISTASNTEEKEDVPSNPNTKVFISILVMILFMGSMITVLYLGRKYSFLK